MPYKIVTGIAVAGATVALAVECGLAGVAVKTATVAATPAPTATTIRPAAATPARPASVPATGDTWVCQWGAGGPGGLAPTQALSADCQAWGAQHGDSGTAVRTQVSTYPTFTHCGHWDVHQVHLDSDLAGPNANIAHYDANWQLIPSGVC
jgi:hypothetical protein